MAKKAADRLHREKGFSMFEFVWVIVILMVLYACSYMYLSAMKETVERTDFVSTLNRVQAQLTLKVAEWYAVGTEVSRSELESKNPLSLIDSAPDNYQGELTSDRLSNCGLSQWCFVTDTKRLVYRVRYSSELENSYDQKDFLVYRLKLTLDNAQDEWGLPTELALVPEYRFIWQNVGF